MFPMISHSLRALSYSDTSKRPTVDCLTVTAAAEHNLSL